MELNLKSKTGLIRTTVGRVAIKPSGPQKKIWTNLDWITCGYRKLPHQFFFFIIMAYSTQPSSDTNNDQKTVTQCTRHKHDINSPTKFKDTLTDDTNNSQIKQLYKFHAHLCIKITFCSDAHLSLFAFRLSPSTSSPNIQMCSLEQTSCLARREAIPIMWDLPLTIINFFSLIK
jgi:hypothetical protein